MPKLSAAYRSSSHRLACLSLYKALLKRSSIIQAPGLRSLIQHRFKADRLLQSPSQIANGLNAGHEVLDLLHASEHGDKPSIAKLISLLESTLNYSRSNEGRRNILRRARTSCGPVRKASKSRPSTDSSKPDSTCSRPLLERPLPLAEIKSHKRRVPSFKVVHGVPILFYSKPQPDIVGRMLSQKIAWSNKKWDQRHQFLGEGIPLGEAEDAWDTLVELQQKQEKLSNQHCASDSNSKNFDSHFQSWASPSQASEAKIAQQIYKFDNTNLKMSRQLVDILKKERALAAKEKTELAALKYEQRVLRRADEFLADAKRKLTSKHDAG